MLFDDEPVITAIVNDSDTAVALGEDEFTVLDTVIKGHQKLWDIMKEKDAIYAKEDFRHSRILLKAAM